MHIPQDVVDLIVDQLSLPADRDWSWYLKDASLVSTAWVNRSQHHLFSTVKFSGRRGVKWWCSKIKPGPYGVSRHVRTLTLGDLDPCFPPPLASDLEVELEPSLPHLTSFKNLQELIIAHPSIARTSLRVLTPIFSSSPGILKLHWWTHLNLDIHETWKDISALADLLPNLIHVNLSDYQNTHTEVQLLIDKGCPLTIKRFKFHKLQIVPDSPLSLPFFESGVPYLQILDLTVFRMYSPDEYFIQPFQTLLEACHTLQVLDLGLYPGTAEFLGSISSSSVSLIRISNPLWIGNAPMTYSDSWPWVSFEDFEHCRCMNEGRLAVFTHLGVSIRKIAQRYSDHHSGLKTRVQATLDLTESEAQAVQNGEVLLYKTRLEEELGDHVDFELILVTWPDPELSEPDTDD